MEGAHNTYQWCIIDCPPSVGLLTFNALRAADEVLVPVETGFFSLQGLAGMMETIEEFREHNHRDIRVRILPTLYDTRTKLAREVLQELRGKFREFLTQSTINFNTKLKEAASFGQPITEYDPGSRGYKDFVNLARELMGHRPVEVEPVSGERLSRPAELVQRAKQLAQLTTVQFGRTSAPVLASAGGNGNGEAHATSSDQAAKTTLEKIEEFYGVKQVDGAVMFCVQFDNANQVMLAGDFNNWSPVATPMLAGGRPGEWRMKLPLRPGRYRYRFVVDGRWITDPHNRYVEANQFGELDNVVEVD